jgi:3-oxoacyl-[acyl-carrier-protein] synthase II
MSCRRVVITGLSAITPIGLNLEDSWENLCDGKSGITIIDRFDTSKIKNKIAGLVKNFNPEEFFDKKFIRRTDRMQHLFMATADACMKDSLFDKMDRDIYKLSVIGTSCIGAYRLFEENCKLYFEDKVNKMSPFLILNLASNVIAGDVAVKYDFKGPQHFLQEACASGTKAIGLALRMIQKGEIDAALVVASESGIMPTIMASLGNLTVLADAKWNNCPEKASRPFDRGRSGFVLSEGSGAILLETLEYAKKRNAKIYAEVCGFGATTDSSHSIAPNPDAVAIVKCMEDAINDAKIKLNDVDYINAHGTSTYINDLIETKAIKILFGKYAYKIPISSNKSMIGHLLAASGLIEAIFSVKTINDSIIPPTINLENPDPECDLDYVPNKSRKKNVNVVMSNSFGFGGVNASIVLKKYME